MGVTTGHTYFFLNTMLPYTVFVIPFFLKAVLGGMSCNFLNCPHLLTLYTASSFPVLHNILGSTFTQIPLPSSRCFSLEKVLELGWTRVLNTDDHAAFQKHHPFRLPPSKTSGCHPSRCWYFRFTCLLFKGVRNKGLFTGLCCLLCLIYGHLPRPNRERSNTRETRPTSCTKDLLTI